MESKREYKRELKQIIQGQSITIVSEIDSYASDNYEISCVGGPLTLEAAGRQSRIQMRASEIKLTHGNDAEVAVRSGFITIKASDILLDGDATVSGDLTVNGQTSTQGQTTTGG